ncbi:hypothetical protein C9374_003536 [Naegleria lovaniensis]|uniref:Uncharacterized protein n=1 Tax=Naegleria lovaniensis TaxID=51637 RepID=A0AA88KLV0_NAELO|nr:uncharacterized protein C9374_003536 [Naegleria lovaniensis]KAG2385721.1 hypothetical protein C9374_003536 [Naegleria lovaniensis]
MNDEEEEHDDPEEEENEVEETMNPKHNSRKDKTLPHGQDEVAFHNQRHHHHHKDPRTSNVNLLDSRFVHMSTLNDDIFNPNENVTTSGGEQHSTVDHSLIHATTGKPISIVHVQHHPKMSTSSSPHLAKNSQFPTNHGTLENNHVMSTDLTPPTSGPIEDELDSFLNSIHQSNQF